jgi:hypothetical protein
VTIKATVRRDRDRGFETFLRCRVFNTYRRIRDMLIIKNEVGFIGIWSPPCFWIYGYQVPEIFITAMAE